MGAWDSVEGGDFPHTFSRFCEHSSERTASRLCVQTTRQRESLAEIGWPEGGWDRNLEFGAIRFSCPLLGRQQVGVESRGRRLRTSKFGSLRYWDEIEWKLENQVKADDQIQHERQPAKETGKGQPLSGGRMKTAAPESHRPTSQAVIHWADTDEPAECGCLADLSRTSCGPGWRRCDESQLKWSKRMGGEADYENCVLRPRGMEVLQHADIFGRW